MVQYFDDGKFTVGNPVHPMAAWYYSTRDSVDDQDIGILAMTSKRGLYVSPEDTDGTTMGDGSGRLKVSIEVDNVGIGGGTQYTEGDTDATITGTAILWEDATNTLKSVNASDPLPVNVVAGSTSGTEYTEGDTDATISGVALMWEDAADTLRAISATKPLPVDLGSNNDVTITSGSITANAGTNLNTSALALESGGNLDTIAGDTTSIDGKITACNTGAITISAELPAGTNNIGKVVPSDGTTDLKLPTSVVVEQGASALTLLAAGGASNYYRIFLLTISADTAGLLTVSDGIGKHYISANGSVVLDFAGIGKKQTTSNTILTITNSGGGNIAVTGLYSIET